MDFYELGTALALEKFAIEFKSPAMRSILDAALDGTYKRIARSPRAYPSGKPGGMTLADRLGEKWDDAEYFNTPLPHGAPRPPGSVAERVFASHLPVRRMLGEVSSSAVKTRRLKGLPTKPSIL
jgi:hypothetical protein